MRQPSRRDVSVRTLPALLAAAGAGFAARPAVAAEKINVGLLSYVTAGPIYIADARGYFRDAGLEVSLKPFDSSQNVVVAVASRDLDFGVTSLTAGFYNLANKGAMKAIGGQVYEKKGFVGNVFVVSRKAWDAGFRSVKDFKGRSFGLNQTGSSLHYTLARSLELVGVRMADVEVRVLQTVANMLSAVRTGQVDGALVPPVLAAPLVSSGEVRQIAVASDFVEYQVGGIFVNLSLIRDRTRTVEAFARAYRLGLADYAKAFLTKGADGAVARTDETEPVARLISKAIYGVEDKVADVVAAAAYISPEARLDVADVERQVAWYKANGFIDAGVEARNVVDTRFIPPLGT